jgi:hypothetical protein
MEETSPPRCGAETRSDDTLSPSATTWATTSRLKNHLVVSRYVPRTKGGDCKPTDVREMWKRRVASSASPSVGALCSGPPGIQVRRLRKTTPRMAERSQERFARLTRPRCDALRSVRLPTARRFVDGERLERARRSVLLARVA